MLDSVSVWCYKERVGLAASQNGGFIPRTSKHRLTPAGRIRIRSAGPEVLPEIAHVPTAFTVSSAYRVEEPGTGLGFRLVKEAVPGPYVKDYDALEGGVEGPLSWPRKFDVTNWRFFLARDGDQPVGGAVVAHDTPDVFMLESRKDLACLWDLRVHPQWRRRGIGTQLFDAATAWARSRGCRLLKIETQNVNVPACEFYASRRCILGGINRFGYAGRPGVSDEVMLLWYLDLKEKD